MVWIDVRFGVRFRNTINVGGRLLMIVSLVGANPRLKFNTLFSFCISTPLFMSKLVVLVQIRLVKE